MIYNSTKSLVNTIMQYKVPQSKICLDMTFGNGNDSYNMFSINSDIKVFAFDIQKQCTDNFKNIEGLTVINDSHENFEIYVKTNVDFVIFNLGYLPGGDKKITTNYSVVINTIQKILKKLNLNGVVIITFYPGHKSGLEESIKIVDYLKKLNQKVFNVIRYDFINQINNPPFVCLIERIK